MSVLWGRLALVLGSVLVLLGGAELLARTLWHPDQQPVSGYGLPAHRTRLWGLPPGEVLGSPQTPIHINAQGLRAVELTGAPLRALTLGDSNIFGHELADGDTLHAALRTELLRAGLDVDVLCGGVPGYSILQSLRLLDDVGWALKPDLLVVGNLLSDSTSERFRDQDLLAALDRPGRQAADSLLRHSAALRWLSLWLRPLSNAERNIVWLRTPGVVEHARVPVPSYRQALETLADRAASRGVGVIFLELATADALRGEPDGEAWRLAMRLVAEQRGIPHVSGVAALRAAGLDVDTALLDPVHANPAGQRAYAQALADALVVAGWPEQDLAPAPR
ncbi:MAG: hypothetical protein GXP62_13900 [Oligoflexia bacterium]|nr:hypothetical protein [Oligoflexia bacterium]